MKQYAMTIIFEDGTIDLCKVKQYNERYMRVIPLEGNSIITLDFVTMCSTKEELIDEMRIVYEKSDYITIKEWKEND